MNFGYHPKALAELEHETLWYERRQAGLGRELADLVEETVGQILLTPLTFPAVPERPRFRRFVLKRFPFAIVYMIRGESVIIVALAHTKKRPGYWANRAP